MTTPSLKELLDLAEREQVHSSWGPLNPMVRTVRGTWTNHHMSDNGDIGERITVDEATHFGVSRFYVLPADGEAAAALRSLAVEGEK